MNTSDSQPILNEKQKAHWETVDKTLVSWAKRVRSGRRILLEKFEKYGGIQTAMIVPCECGSCDTVMEMGEPVLIIDWEVENRDKRVFCSVACQRRNTFDVLGAVNAKRRKYSRPKV